MGKKPCFGRWRWNMWVGMSPTSVPSTADGRQPTGSHLGFQWNPCVKLKFIWKERCTTLQIIIKDYFERPALLPDLIWYSHVHWRHVSVWNRKSFLFCFVLFLLLVLFSTFFFLAFFFKQKHLDTICQCHLWRKGSQTGQDSIYVSASVHKWAPSIFLAYDFAYSPSLEEPANSPAATRVLNFLNCFPTAKKEVVGLSLWPTKSLQSPGLFCVCQAPYPFFCCY